MPLWLPLCPMQSLKLRCSNARPFLCCNDSTHCDALSNLISSPKSAMFMAVHKGEQYYQVDSHPCQDQHCSRKPFDTLAVDCTASIPERTRRQGHCRTGDGSGVPDGIYTGSFHQQPFYSFHIFVWIRHYFHGLWHVTRRSINIFILVG